MPQVWKPGDPISEPRKAALAQLEHWYIDLNAVAKGQCEVNAKTDAQLDQEAKAVAAASEKEAREKAEAAKREAIAAAEQQARNKIEAAKQAVADAKREKEEAIAKAKQEREDAEQEKREAAQAVLDHAKEIRDGIRDGSIKLLSATDLSAQSHKWDGKKIITTLSCFYADACDYRCVGGHVRIDFSSFEPDNAEEAFKNNCDTITKSQRRACSLRILFTYSGFDEMDTGSGLFGGKITLVEPQFKSGEILTK